MILKSEESEVIEQINCFERQNRFNSADSDALARQQGEPQITCLLIVVACQLNLHQTLVLVTSNPPLIPAPILNLSMS